MHAEFIQFLIQSETGRLSCDFKEYSTGFAEINRMKIRTIDHGRDVIAKINQMFPPFYLFGLVPRAKGNVMHRTRGNTPHAWCPANKAGQRFCRAPRRLANQSESDCPILQSNDSRNCR